MKQYAELAKQANEAVAAIKDPELRRVAFEKILDDLINDGSSAATEKRTKSSGKKTPPNKKTPTSGPQAYVEELVDENFFKNPKTISEVKEELGKRGRHIVITSISGPLQKLCQRRTLRRQKTKKGKASKQTFSYSNW